MTPAPLLTAAVLLSVSMASPRGAGAQQYITDDAAITEDKACQIQMWHGQRASWVLPVCTPVRRLELSLGFIAVWEDGADGHFEYVAQLKTVFKPLSSDSWGVGIVMGTGRDPAFSGVSPETNSIYTYVPVSVSLARDRVVIHQNTGWLYRRASGKGDHGLTWAVRGDISLLPRLAVIGDLYGAERIGGNGRGGAAPAEFQLGVRSWARAERVQFDLSYGAALRTGRRAQGWTFGLTLVTPPFL